MGFGVSKVQPFEISFLFIKSQCGWGAPPRPDTTPTQVRQLCQHNRRPPARDNTARGLLAVGLPRCSGWGGVGSGEPQCCGPPPPPPLGAPSLLGTERASGGLIQADACGLQSPAISFGRNHPSGWHLFVVRRGDANYEC